MSIINEFSSEKELFEVYPKKFHWYLKDIFLDYWDDFLDFANKKNISIRPVVLRDVSRMMKCKTPALGGSVFKCPSCGEEKFVYHTCKSKIFIY